MAQQARDIKRRIKSVENTKQITRTMKELTNAFNGLKTNFAE